MDKAKPRNQGLPTNSNSIFGESVAIQKTDTAWSSSQYLIIINTNIDKDKNNEKIFKNIKILYTNVDQLNEGKKTELKEIIRQYKPLIIAICEIKPKKNNK